MSLARLTVLAVACWLLLGPRPARAQAGDDYDASWYNPEDPYVQIDVAADGVYRVSGSTLRDALPDGTSLADISPETIQVFEKGEEIPIQINGADDGRLDDADTITFIGRRNRGTDEHWAYNYSRQYDERAQSSTYYSLYSDTTTYWMTWGDTQGRRYETPSPSPTSASTAALRDTLHAEQDNRYYFGRPFENGNAKYTFSEGYFWTRLSHNDTSPLTFTHTLSVGRRTDASTDLDLSVRLDSGTNSCHRVELEVELESGFEPQDTVEWRGYERQTITTSVSQENIPSDGLTVRLTSYNDNFSLDDCPNPSTNPNYVLVDWLDAAYTRSLEATDNTQRFVAPSAQKYTFDLSGYTANTVHVYNPHDAHRYEANVTNGTATITDAPSTAPTPYWAVGTDSFRSPAAVRADTPSNWSDSTAHSADYLILTTEALLPAARKLAEYRRTTDNALTDNPNDTYSVEIALVQNVFDEFDYGRPTPLAIRRFVRASQTWSTPPDFLTIFADAQYPIRDGSVETLYPEWSVPSFGYSPSDGWFAMQTDGPGDWSEILAVGRIPVRSVEQGNLFVEKLKSYESAPLQRWQKRMLLLAGGTSAGEQQALQGYSDRWGEIATDTFATTPSYTGPVRTGADTLRYYKKVNDALDTSFQDSLAVDLRRGSGWLSYFGHSAAQTWEIVTDPPSEFDNAGRLPIVVSLGCRTGSFAGGRFEEKSAPSLGEQLVVGSVRPDGTPRDGSMNGGIAHFGESALGNRLPSAIINDKLIQRVFVDTMRVLGEAIRDGKEEVAAERGNSQFYVKHLLQYGLLGDPATKIALPTKPDFHVAPNLLSITPNAPTLSNDLTLSVEVQNRGLIPSDSVDVHLTWQRPDGSTAQRTRRVQRFALTRTLQFSFPLDERAVGQNTFQVRVDPDNEYDEVNPNNNTAEKTQVVFSTGIDLISPSDQGIVPRLQPDLQFSLPRRDSESASVTLQLDSTSTFDSPALQQTTVESPSLSETWTPTEPLHDSTTYYWRGRRETSDQMQWRQGRFTVRTDLSGEGWLQQGPLFQDNENDRLAWTSQEAWTFGTFTRDVLVSSEEGGGGFKGVISLDGTQRFENRTLGFGIVVVDGASGRVKKNESFCTYNVSDGVLNERRCGGGVDGSAAADLMENFLQSIDRGDYVFVRTRHLARSGSADISDRVERLLRTLGSSGVAHSEAMANDSLDYNDLWLMLAKKGSPDQTIERTADDTNEIVERQTFSFLRPQGQTTPSRIGPVTAWDSLRWRATGTENDALAIDVLAPDTNQVLQRTQGLTGTVSLEDIDPSQNPYLRLRATLRDSVTRTPPQLKRWSVTYEGVPELAVNPSGLASIPDTTQQGEALSVSLPISNLGSVSSRSVRVSYEVTDADNTTTTAATDTLTALSPGATDTSSVRLSTTRLPGSNVLTATATAVETPERLATNNTAIQNFFVRKDQTPPSVTVFVNDQELHPPPDSLNDFTAPSLPFVSIEPTFDIRLDDNNPYLSLADTSHMDVYLKGGLPSDASRVTSEFERIPFSSDQLTLTASDSSDENLLRARFDPTLPPRDSTYTLKVEASDSQGNEMTPYQGSFRVKPDQEIKDVYPYPNPMSTHTTFAFRVIGGRNDVLRDFRLRIYTLSGRLVRELDQSELQTLGPDWYGLRWNGRDEDGERVATGVYLYRVLVESAETTFRGDVEKVTVIR